MLRCQRRVCRFRIDGTNDEFCGLYRIPTIEARLTAARLQYVARVWSVGPDILRELLICEGDCTSTGWLQSVRVDLEWYQDILESRSLLLDTSIEAAALVWRDSPKEWKKSVKLAFRYAVMQESLAADVRGWHHIMISDIKQFNGEIEGYFDSREEGQFRCFCGHCSKTPQGLAAHRRLRHAQNMLQNIHIPQALAALFALNGSGRKTECGYVLLIFHEEEAPIDATTRLYKVDGNQMRLSMSSRRYPNTFPITKACVWMLFKDMDRTERLAAPSIRKSFRLRSFWSDSDMKKEDESSQSRST